MGAEVGPHRLQGRLHPGPHVLGVQAVHDEEAGDEVVGDQIPQRVPARLAALGEDGEDPGQSLAVELGHEAHELLGPLPGHGPARGEGLEQRLDALPGRAEHVGMLALRRRFPVDAHSPVIAAAGECVRSRCLPSPRYMWTPHGRQGSKLRTVRMMSIPLKFSRSFSSKIG